MKKHGNEINTDYGLYKSINYLQNLIKSFAGTDEEKSTICNLLIMILEYKGRSCCSFHKSELWLKEIQNETVLLKMLIKFKKWKDFLESYEEWRHELHKMVKEKLMEKKMTVYEMASIAHIQPSLIINVLKGKEEISMEVISIFESILKIPASLAIAPKPLSEEESESLEGITEENSLLSA